MQDCSISIANALEILQSCTKPSIWTCKQMNGQAVLILPFCWNFSGHLFTKKTPSYWYRDSRYKPETVVRPSEVYNGDPYTHKTASSKPRPTFNAKITWLPWSVNVQRVETVKQSGPWSGHTYDQTQATTTPKGQNWHWVIKARFHYVPLLVDNVQPQCWVHRRHCVASPWSCQNCCRGWRAYWSLPDTAWQWSAETQGKIWSTFNSLWSSDALPQHISGSTLAQIMACCLMAASHYLSQCWLVIREVLWHSPESDFTRSAHELNRWEVFNY